MFNHAKFRASIIVLLTVIALTGAPIPILRPAWAGATGLAAPGSLPGSPATEPGGGLSPPQGIGLAKNFTWLLPDLRTLPPSDLRILVSQGGARRILRFSNTVANSGPGALEMRGLLDPEGDTILITQIIFRLNGSQAGRRIGESIFHPTHEHWHFEGFAIYEIWRAADDGTLLERMASSGKVGYCGRDDRRLRNEEIGRQPGDEDYPGRRSALYTGCNWQLQGISPGWTDIYRHHLPGQEMDISQLPDGLYALKSAVNPEGNILEADYDNNANLVYFFLDGERLEVFGL